ncbi:MAG TPA: sigma-70 family RNA polymerase sigma factor [Polyangiaceae bacterium]
MIPAEARGAWREVEARLRPYVARRVPSPADVDDVLQDTFVRMQRGLATLADGERFGAWVYRVASSAVADHLRMRARHPLAGAKLDDAESETAGADDEHPLESELAECVALFVARLPSPYREAVTLTELEGLTQKDAAEMLGVSLSGMKSRVQRGRERIRRMFEQCCELSVDGRGRVTDCTPRRIEEVPDDCRAAAASWASRREPSA